MPTPTERLRVIALAFVACGPEPATSETSGGTGTSTASPVTTTEAGTTPTTGTPTTGSDTSTGPCGPTLPPLAEAEFPARLATEICEQKAACGCAVAKDCVADFTASFAKIRDYGQTMGFTYDATCTASDLALVGARGCMRDSEIDHSLCPQECDVYRGDAIVDAPCALLMDSDVLFFVQPCAAPLRCDYGLEKCKPPQAIGMSGEACFDNQVGFLVDCEPDTACDILGSQTCEPLQGEGKSCTGFGLCDRELFCADDTGLCVPARNAGQPCDADDQCLSFVCGDNKCLDDIWICGVTKAVEIRFDL